MHVTVVSVLGGAPALDDQPLSGFLHKKAIGRTGRPVRAGGILQHTRVAVYGLSNHTVTGSCH